MSCSEATTASEAVASSRRFSRLCGGHRCQKFSLSYRSTTRTWRPPIATRHSARVKQNQRRSYAALLARDKVAAIAARSDTAVFQRTSNWDVLGSGETVDEAWQNALENSYHKVDGYLHERFPGLRWPLSTEFIGERLVKRKNTEEPQDIGESLPALKRVSLHVEITPDDQALILQKDRQFRVEHRMIWLGGILAAVLVLLATCATYVRLDEASKGYYTGWLRLAATSLIATATLGLWYFTSTY